MRHSKLRRWSLLVSGILIFTVGAGTGRRTVAQHLGDPVYPGAGFWAIATGQQVSFYISPQVSQVSGGIHTAQNAWNAARNGGSTNYAYHTTSASTSQQVQHIYWPIASECGTYIYKGVSCVAFVAGPYCYSTIQSDGQPQPGLEHALAAAHELGHAMFGLIDEPLYDCNTIMSACWFDMTTVGPTAADAHVARTMYSIPDDLWFVPNYAYDNQDYYCWSDNSAADQQTLLDVFRWNGASWDFYHTVTRPANPGTGGTCFGEYITAGSDWYIFGIRVLNVFSNGYSGYQHGGYSNAAWHNN